MKRRGVIYARVWSDLRPAARRLEAEATMWQAHRETCLAVAQRMKVDVWDYRDLYCDHTNDDDLWRVRLRGLLKRLVSYWDAEYLFVYDLTELADDDFVRLRLINIFEALGLKIVCANDTTMEDKNERRAA